MELPVSAARRLTGQRGADARIIDPFNAVVDARNKINELDGYHPVSLVLYVRSSRFYIRLTAA